MAVPAYMNSVKNVPAIFAAIREAGVPEKFTHQFLKQLGFTSSRDRGVIAVMKSLRFLDDAGAPTDRYKRYRDPPIAEAVMAEAMRDAYSDLFKVNENAQTLNTTSLKGAFKRVSEKGDAVSEKMATTFKALGSLADWSSSGAASATQPGSDEGETLDVLPSSPETPPEPSRSGLSFGGSLRHDIHVHLPVSTEVKVYDAIFRSLKEHFG